MRFRNSARPLALALVLGASACRGTPASAVSPRPTLLAPQSAALTPVAQLQHDIDSIVAAPTLGHGFWGICAKAVAGGDVLYAANADRLLMPASTLKIVTLAAAAERLGWDYTYETRVVAVGSIADGVLDGDLVVVGSGDPSLDDWDGTGTRVFEGWADQLQSAGIRTVTGRIVGDDNAFDDEGFGFGWSWDDLAAGFAAGVGALQYNESSVMLTISPGGSVGAPATITIAPAANGLTIRNLIVTGPANRLASIERRRLPGSTRLELRGTIPVKAPAIQETASVDNPTLFYVSALRNVLIARGIDVRGPAVDIDDLTVPPPTGSGRTLVSYRSPPLSMMAAILLRLSQNQFAETFLRTLGAGERPGSAERGRAAVRTVLESWSIPANGVMQADGSGLSRYNLATAAALVAVLDHVAHDPRLNALFEAALPVAGRDQPIQGRLQGTAAEGRARIKTGSMAGVRAAAGYTMTADGERVAFAILANNFDVPTSAITQAEDAIIARLSRFSRRP